MSSNKPSDQPPPRDAAEIAKAIREAPTFAAAVAIVKGLSPAEIDALGELARREGR